MRKYLFALLGISILIFSSTALKASTQVPSEKQTLKARQKQERNAQKLQKRYAMQAYKNPQVSKAMRDQKKHELQSQRRELRDKQKTERQELKDRQKVLKQSNKRV
jgi:hypothetical protein